MMSIAGARTHRLRQAALVLLLGYWLAIFAGTHIPSPPPVLPPDSDKWAHLASYTALAFLVGLNGALRVAWTWRHSTAVVLALALWGAVDEFTQIPVGRHCDLRDWFADVIGIVGGLTIFSAVLALRRSAGRRLQGSDV